MALPALASGLFGDVFVPYVVGLTDILFSEYHQYGGDLEVRIELVYSIDNFGLLIPNPTEVRGFKVAYFSSLIINPSSLFPNIF